MIIATMHDLMRWLIILRPASKCQPPQKHIWFCIFQEHRSPLTSSVTLLIRFCVFRLPKSIAFESLQDSGFPGAPLFILFYVFGGEKSVRNPRKQADFIVFWSAPGSAFSGYTTFRVCTNLHNKVVCFFRVQSISLMIVSFARPPYVTLQ